MGNKKIILLFVSLILVSFSFGCISTESENNSSEISRNNPTESKITETEPYDIKHIPTHNIYPYYTYDELQEGSPIIASGQIISISESKWSTSDGKKPESVNVTEEVDENGTLHIIEKYDLNWDEYIYTDAVFKIETIYKGDLKEDEIVVRFLTGIADGWRISETAGLDIQSYEEGETYLFFLTPYITRHEGKIPNHYRVVTPRGALMKQESATGLTNQNQETFVNFDGEQFTPKILIE